MFRLYPLSRSVYKSLMSTFYFYFTPVFDRGPAICARNQIAQKRCSLYFQRMHKYVNDYHQNRFQRGIARPFFVRERINDFEIYYRNSNISFQAAEKHLADGYSVDVQVH